MHARIRHAQAMAKAQESDAIRRIREAADSLGMSSETVQGLAPPEFDLSLATAKPQEEDRGSSGTPAADLLIAELQDRIFILEQRLDDADAERHELLTAFGAERRRLVRLLVEQQEGSVRRGIWPTLKRLYRRLAKKKSLSTTSERNVHGNGAPGSAV